MAFYRHRTEQKDLVASKGLNIALLRPEVSGASRTPQDVRRATKDAGSMGGGVD